MIHVEKMTKNRLNWAINDSQIFKPSRNFAVSPSIYLKQSELRSLVFGLNEARALNQIQPKPCFQKPLGKWTGFNFVIKSI